MKWHHPLHLVPFLICLALGLGSGPSGRCATVLPTAAAVAVVTNLDGPAQLHRGAERHELAVLDVLLPGDELQLQTAAAAELAFTAGTGSVLQLTGPGRFRVRNGDVLARDPAARVERRDLAAAWRGLRIRPGLVGRASIALRGLAATQVSLRAPLGGQDGADLRRLEWDRPYGHPAGAWDYTVRIIDDQGTLLFVARSQERSVALPDSLDFERGRDYLWTVQAQAQDRSGVYGAAEFHRVAADVEAGMRALTQSVVALRRDPAQAESTAEEVLLALALEQAGLRNAAQRQWRALAPLRPALAIDPRRLP
jgi:hypothetical protein